jgi:cytochrome c-type biogenesis protein CcmH
VIRRSLFVALFALAGIAMPVAGRLPAQQRVPVETTPRTPADSVLEARTSAVASQLRCPVCQGLSIQDSPSDLSQSMRAVVREQLAQGKTPEQVKAYFVSKYGEWILLAPAAHGFNLLAYSVPLLVVLGGGAGIVIAVRRWTRPPVEPTVASPSAAPDESPRASV